MIHEEASKKQGLISFCETCNRPNSGKNIERCEHYFITLKKLDILNVNEP